MKKQIQIVVTCLVIILVVFTIGIVYVVRHRGSKAVSYVGQLELVDTTGMATDAPGIYKLRSGGDLITVHLDAGESACDRNAVTVPSVKVGDKVSVSGERGTDGIVRVCAQGTYIKVAQ